MTHQQWVCLAPAHILRRLYHIVFIFMRCHDAHQHETLSSPTLEEISSLHVIVMQITANYNL